MYCGFNIVHVYYIIPHTRLSPFHFRKFKSKNVIDLCFMASVRLYQLQNSKIPFWKDTTCLTGVEKMVFLQKVFCISASKTWSAKLLKGILENTSMQKVWEMISKMCCEMFCKTTELCSTKILKVVSKTG